MRHAPLFVAALGLGACDDADEAPAAPPLGALRTRADAVSLAVGAGEISLVTTLDGQTEVPARLDGLTGSFEAADLDHLAGLAGALEIDLSRWSSDLDERDRNVKTVFFGIEEAPVARFTVLRLDGVPESGLAVGEQVDGTVAGRLAVAGVEHDVSARVRLRRSDEEALYVSSAEPLRLSIDALGLGERLTALMTKCKHDAIEDAVVVSFGLQLAAPGASAGEASPAGAPNTHRSPRR